MVATEIKSGQIGQISQSVWYCGQLVVREPERGQIGQAAHSIGDGCQQITVETQIIQIDQVAYRGRYGSNKIIPKIKTSQAIHAPNRCRNFCDGITVQC
ncbi:hypothetical protein ES708_09733 [subsurface metagenome]